MSVLKMMFAKHAPTHHAEKYWPAHDEFLNVGEARRGRGKSYGATVITLEWFRERWAGIVSGADQFGRVFSNIRFHHHYMALLLCREKIAASLEQAKKVLLERLIFVDSWHQILTAYNSLIIIDEANRNFNVYDMSKKAQEIMVCIHDWLQQTRKHKLTIWFLVQDVEWLKSQVLSLMDRLWRAKRVRIKGTMKIKYFPWYGGDPYSKGKSGPLSRSADMKMKFDFDMWYARCYDTRQAVPTLKQEVEFKTFEEISDYMFAHGMKPKPVNSEFNGLGHEEVNEWFDTAKSVRIGPLAPAWSPVPSLPGLAGGGGTGGTDAVPGGKCCQECRLRVLAASLPPLDLTSLPTSFPSAS